jgi:hypothetical protein
MLPARLKFAFASMSRHSRSARLLQTAEAALISAIEIYNKPTFAYREETFAILALNAWELLLKAELLNLLNNDLRASRTTAQTGWSWSSVQRS